MKLKLKHLRHPLRAANAAKTLAASRLSIKKIAERGERDYAGDSRLDPRNVAAGFANRVKDHRPDERMLGRICAAYAKAVERERLAPAAYRATTWWEQVRQANLRPVMQALLRHDLEALHHA